MGWLVHILNFFKTLFGKFDKAAHTVITAASPLVNMAIPIVTELAALAAGFPQAGGLIGAVELWLPTVVSDATKVQTWVNGAQNLSTADILRSAAQLALKELVPNATLASEINFAIEFALQIFKKSAAAAPIAAVAALVAVAPTPAPVPEEVPAV